MGDDAHVVRDVLDGGRGRPPLIVTRPEPVAAVGEPYLIAGFDPLDPGSANEPVPDYLDAVERGRSEGLRGLRVGVIRHFYRNDMVAHPAVDAGLEAALEVLAGLGAHVEEVSTRPLGEFADGNRVILLSEGYAVHERWMQSRPHCKG